MAEFHRRPPHPWRDKRGIAALETAVVAPFLLLIIVACVDFGRARSQSIELTNAVRAGAQYAVTVPQFEIQSGKDDPVTKAVKDALPAYLKTGTTVTTTCYCGRLQGDTGMPNITACNLACDPGDPTVANARMMTIRAERNFTPVNFALTPTLASKFGLSTVSGHVTLRHQ